MTTHSSVQTVALEAAMSCVDVSMTYPAMRSAPGVEALKGISLHLAPNSITVIIGASGCGKSTLLRLLGGLDTPTHGRITVGDCSAADARRDKRFGFVPQAPTLLTWRTVRENVTLLTEVNRRRGRFSGAAPTPTPTPTPAQARSRGEVVKVVDEIITAVGLAGFADARTRTLSGGMAQRVALARAFVLGAPILLLDEPFAALDELTRAEMRRLLCELWRTHRSTVVFTTHDLNEAVLLADRVIVLSSRPGRVFADIEVGLERPSPQGIEDTETFRSALREVRHALHQAASHPASQAANHPASQAANR